MWHYNDIIMGMMASQITSLTIVCPTINSCADQRKHQSSASLAFVLGIHRWPVNSLRKGPVTRKMFPFDDVIMIPRTIYDECCARSRYVSRAGTSNYIPQKLWYVITCPCPWYLHLTQHSSYKTSILCQIYLTSKLCCVSHYRLTPTGLQVLLKSEKLRFVKESYVAMAWYI